ncbi:Prostaglandin reductase 3 [Phytophthora boehmeriae]|uniref:Prostaglandin reductase 3 n=1 Tax=Phytophthora boehmeriae TaxID=109152 RepID=A0A8T1WMK3_9STRA|nr:Prostaglandin reductase 3 [Phytophthora boehmeriae]
MPSYRELLCTKLSTNFREATEIVTHPELPKASAGHVVVKNKFLGVNATDINVTNGVFNENPPPFGTGLDAAGTVVEVGPGVSEVKVGDHVVYDKFGAYAEYVEVPIGSVHKLPELSPAALPLTVCGISASIAITECGELSTNETVFVTAAAGGAGQFVVQLAKMAGNHVIGTCSNDEKVEYLKKLSCDRVINYNKESIDAVLKKEYPKGINIAFETIGGDMFKTVFDNMAIRGRIIVFGHISEYRGDTPRSPFTVSAMNEVLLMKAITVRGFLLRTYSDIIPTHMANLFKLIQEGKLQAGVDPTKFRGLEQVPDAIDHMYAHKNIGKIVIELPTEAAALP